MAGLKRLELSTFGVTGRRSNRLSYNPIANAERSISEKPPFVKREKQKKLKMKIAEKRQAECKSPSRRDRPPRERALTSTPLHVVDCASPPVRPCGPAAEAVTKNIIMKRGIYP